MAEDYEKTSRKSTEKASDIAEITISWGAVIAIVLIAVAMIKGVFGS